MRNASAAGLSDYLFRVRRYAQMRVHKHKTWIVTGWKQLIDQLAIVRGECSAWKQLT